MEETKVIIDTLYELRDGSVKVENKIFNKTEGGQNKEEKQKAESQE